MNSREYPIYVRGRNTWRRQAIYPGVSLVGCVASFQVRNLDTGKNPTTLRFEMTSGVDQGLTITHLQTAIDVRGVSCPVGSGVVTLQISESAIEAIPVGKYAHELKIIWPAISGESAKEPIWFGAFIREATINSA